MATKNIPDPGFSDDDGTADPRLSAALTAWAADRSAEPQVLAALKDARLLVPVVAMLGEVETDPGTGLKREKTSDMAVPTLTAGDRRALPAFTSIASLALWDPAARPVAVPLHQALAAAAHEKADTIVVDLAGPVAYQLTGSALLALAEGRTDAGPLADPAVREAVRAVVEADPAVVRAHLVRSGADADGTLAVVLSDEAGRQPEAAARRVAGALAADETLRGRLVRGLDLALLLPQGPVPPGEPLFTR
ncbi:SseB family protein [Streptomyces sp. NPDC054904]|uniref:SseB family protein n=1 Tax=unclassified Streptomyces TaxID=2593676 RepID=UPI002481DDB2|nr:SseB family protein [Streptomyces sp. Isolate_45]MDA5285871.1 SseB family protein [Streptomyces sp. Isolate_45]